MSANLPWFKIATEGPTSDDRYIKPEWIDQMAATYDPSKYTARVFVEHMRGMSPDSSFKCGGSVSAVKIETVDGKKCLFAQIQANDFLKQLNQTDQKVFASIEVDDTFAGTGQAYLTGMGVTDTPASLGLDVLKFSKQSAFAQGISGSKQVYLGEELDVAMFSNDDKNLVETLSAAFKNVLVNMFGSKTNAPTEPAQSSQAPQIGVTSEAIDAASLSFSNQIQTVFQQFSKQFATQAQVAELVERLDLALKSSADNYTQRPVASGATTQANDQADC